MKLSAYRRLRRMETCQHPVAALVPVRDPDGSIRTYRCPACGACGDLLPYMIRPIRGCQPGAIRKTIRHLFGLGTKLDTLRGTQTTQIHPTATESPAAIGATSV